MSDTERLIQQMIRTAKVLHAAREEGQSLSEEQVVGLEYLRMAATHLAEAAEQTLASLTGKGD